MEILKQLSILAANQPGILANICGSLSDEKINIIGISVVDHVDHALIRLVVDKPTRAVHLLGEAGLPIIEGDVLRINISEGPGALEKIANALGEDGLNIDYVYATEPKSGKITNLIIKTSDNERAEKILKKIMP